MIRPFLTTAMKILKGMSYWRVVLASGKVISEDDMSFDLLRGRRPVDWALDIVGAGDIKNIKELHLITPEGDACMPIGEPYTAFQFKRGTVMMFSGCQRIMNAQIIGRVDDKETGACTAVIWDVQEQKLYVDHLTTVHNFSAWREGVAAVGALSLEIVGVRL